MTPVTVSVVVVVVVVVVVSSPEVVVAASSCFAQEMIVRLKRDMSIMYKTLFIFSHTSNDSKFEKSHIHILESETLSEVQEDWVRLIHQHLFVNGWLYLECLIQ